MPRNNMMMVGLRVLLIRKDSKRRKSTTYRLICLRVLLIQKNLKHAMSKAEYWQCLRGLLIQKCKMLLMKAFLEEYLKVLLI